MESTHNVLLHADLAHAIAQHLDVPALSSLRLCSRSLESVASRYLFRNLLISTRKRHLRRLERVAAADKFAKGVRSIEFQVTNYSQPPRKDADEAELDYFFQREQITVEDPRWRKTLLHRLTRLRTDEQEALDTMSLQAILHHAFGRFSGLQQVSVIPSSNLTRQEKPLFDRYLCSGSSGDRGELAICHNAAISGISKHMPTPSTTPDSLKSDINIRMTHMVLTALGSSGSTPKAVDLQCIGHGLLGSMARQHPRLSTMVVQLDSMSETAIKAIRMALSQVSTMSLEVYDQGLLDALKKPQANEVGDLGGRGYFLALVPRLEDLRLSVRGVREGAPLSPTCVQSMDRIVGTAGFASLRKLAFFRLWADVSELCEVLEGHGATLEVLVLFKVNLGNEGADGIKSLRRGLRLTPESHHGENASPVLDSEDTHDWIQVAQTCRALPKLRALEIESPFYGNRWFPVGPYEAEQLISIAMEGRQNSLEQPRVTI